MLHQLRLGGEVDVVGLVTTFNAATDRVAMHGVRMELVTRQAEAAGLPLWPVALPWPCSNAIYEAQMQTLLEQARRQNVTAMAFGDLHLVEIRAYRERLLAGSGIAPLFPLWGVASDTPALAETMLAAGLRATLTCVDPQQLEREFVGQEFAPGLLERLPEAVDRCGENGEFHTFCHSGPMFNTAVPVQIGERVDRDGFCYVDLLSAPATNCA